MIKTIILMLLVCSCLVASQLFLVQTVPIFRGGVSVDKVVRFILSPYLWVAILFTAAGSIIWMYVLSFQQLSVAYPLVSFSYVLMMVAAWFLRGEPITWSKGVGVALICTGVYFLFRGAA